MNQRETETPAEGIAARTVLQAAFLTESLLLIAALSWAYLREIALPVTPDASTLRQGFLASGPLLVFNFAVFGILANQGPRYKLYRRFREEVVRPICRNLTPLQALFIALLSGISEEIFFRGVLNQEFAQFLTPLGGAALGSLIFAYIHFIGAAKLFAPVVLFYFLFGLYFSYLTVSSGSLVPAIIAHILNNFLAVILLRYLD